LYLFLSLFFFLSRSPPSSPLFPYTTLFRSVEACVPPVSPVSSTRGTREPSCFITCSAFEHEGKPEMFALVPVTGPSNSSINRRTDRKSTRLNSSHLGISYAVFCLKKKKKRN